MTLPRWALYTIGGGVLAGLAYLVASSPALPGPPQAVPAGGGGGDGPRRLLTASGALVAGVGQTYFVTLQTHGVLNAATVAGVKARAEAEGFRDVVVSTARVRDWPPLLSGDYFVRATYRGAAPRSFPRHVSVPFGSLDVLDVWEA